MQSGIVGRTFVIVEKVWI